MSIDRNKLFVLVAKALNGKASANEESQLQKWQDEDEENKKLFQKLRLLWNDTSISHKRNIDKSYQKLIDKIKYSNDNYHDLSKSGYKNNVRKYLYWAAAVVFIVISTIFFYEHQQVQLQQTKSIVTINKQNPSGQKSKVHLPDGSIVWLNAESSLQYPADFDSLSRTVHLKGEAFFEVVKDNDRPFSVITGSIITTAIGTSFNISAFKEDEDISVVLSTGIVKVESTLQNDKFLKPGQGLIYNKSSKAIKVKEYDLRSITAWVDGTLVFNEDSFESIVRKLERWYGVQIHVVGDPDQTMEYTGKFKNEYLNNVLESMSFGRPFTYEINDKVVTIKF